MEPTWNVDRLVREFGLRRDTAAEIIASQVQHALRTAWMAWAWLAITLPLAVWAFFAWRHAGGALWPLCFSLAAWHQIGVRVAQSRITAVATAQATRIAAAGGRPRR